MTFFLILLFSLLPAHAQQAAVPKPAVTTEVTEEGIRVRPDRTVPPDVADASRLLMEFGETSLFDLTLFFSDIYRKNFLLADEQALKAKSVVLIGHETMSIDEAWEAYLSALRIHGFTTSDTGELVTIVASKEASSRSEKINAGDPALGGEGIVTQLLPVTNALVSDLLAVVKPLLSKDAEVIAYAPANTLIVTDSASNVKKIHDLVTALAIAAPAQTLRLTHLRYATAREVREVIEALYPTEEKPEPAPTRRTRKSRTPEKAAEATAAGAEARHIGKVLDHERTQTLIVLANPQGHQAVEEIVAQLDVDEDGTRSRLHIVRLKFALAEEVEAVLSHLQSNTRAEPKRPNRPTAQPAPSDLAKALDSGARFAADKATNALAILAEEHDFEAISALIEELDVARRQVFVDAAFVELTSGDGKELSLSAHRIGDDKNPVSVSSQTDAGGKSSSFSVSPDLLTGLAAGVFGPLVDVVGPEGSTLQVPTFGIALRALQTDSDVNVMGNPALLVIDHQEAVLAVGRKIPFPTSKQLSAFGTPIETYDRVDVNMELKVTPHINDANRVTLDVELHVDEVEGSASESNLAGGPITSGRSIQSHVMVEDGQTIVLAGVTGTKVEVQESKVPVLGDIPLIGLLFRGKKRVTRQTNLMVFLTPYLIETPADLIRIRSIKEGQRQEFVRRFQGKGGRAWLDELDALLTDSHHP